MKHIIFCFLASLITAFVWASDLNKAIADGNLTRVKSLLDSNPELINIKDLQGHTPLINALVAENKEISLELINRGADVTIGDNEHTAPIHFAAGMGDIGLLELIRGKGVALDTRDDNGMTPLFYSIRNRKEPMSIYLINQGANVRAVTVNDWPLLLYTAIYGQTETAKLLLDKKVDVNAQTREGIAPIHSATSFGRTDFVKMLVEHGAKIDIQTTEGAMPLAWARNTNTYDIAEYLIGKGADVNHKDQSGTTALMNVAGRGSVNVAELLVQHGANINDMDNDQRTALVMAAWSRDPDGMSKFLILNGAEVNPVTCSHGKGCTCGQNQTTPLHAAAAMGLTDMSKNLVTNGAKINVYNKHGYTPLHVAVKNGNNELVKYLVDQGAFLNEQDKSLGYSELHLAATLGNTELVAWLLEQGSDVNLKTDDGQTALDLAWTYGHKELAYLLLANGASDTKLKEMVSAPDLLAQTPDKGEATVWFLGHSGWAIKTQHHFLIFDYFINPREKAPADSGLASGYIVPEELKGQKVTVFASHSHMDHYSKAIFDWKTTLPDIRYVLCFRPADATGDYTYIPIHGEETIDGMKISTIRSTDLDGGFLVEVDGLVIFHPGDHANREDDLTKSFTDEIDLVAQKGVTIDLAFTPIRGCGLGLPPQVKLGMIYMIDTLHPTLLIPMHAGATTDAYCVTASELNKEKPHQKVQAVVNKGDHFSYQR